MQDRESMSINSQDTSISRSKQLESAIPPSRIASLSSGEFVGAVADNPTEKIELKTFHCEILNDHDALKAEEESYVPIPKVREITQAEIEENYLRIKQEVIAIIDTEMERIYDTPELAHLLVVKEE
jgi:hypothetical protein